MDPRVKPEGDTEGTEGDTEGTEDDEEESACDEEGPGGDKEVSCPGASAYSWAAMFGDGQDGSATQRRGRSW